MFRSRRMAVSNGTRTMSSWSAPFGVNAARPRYADDFEGHGPDTDLLTDGVGPAKMFFTTVGPSTATRRRARSFIGIKRPAGAQRDVADTKAVGGDAGDGGGRVVAFQRTRATCSRGAEATTKGHSSAMARASAGVRVVTVATVR